MLNYDFYVFLADFIDSTTCPSFNYLLILHVYYIFLNVLSSCLCIHISIQIRIIPFLHLIQQQPVQQKALVTVQLQHPLLAQHVFVLTLWPLGVVGFLHHCDLYVCLSACLCVRVLGMVRTVESSRSMPDELLYGRAGYLAALLYLRGQLGADTPPGLTTVMEKVTPGHRSPGGGLCIQWAVIATLLVDRP